MVLRRVDHLVLQELDELVEAGCDDGSEERTDDVDPEVGVKLAVDDGRADGSGGV